MNRQYEILMTDNAERYYASLSLKAKQEAKDGNRITGSIAVFSCIEQALEEISLTPLDGNRSLAGTFSDVYRYSSGSVRISYIVEPDKGQILIYGMCEVQQSLSHFVRMAFESGKLDGLCGALGIDKNNLGEPPRSAYVN